MKNEQMATSETDSAFIHIWTCEENTYGEITKPVHSGSLSKLEDDDESEVILQDTVYRKLLVQLLEEAYACCYFIRQFLLGMNAFPP